MPYNDFDLFDNVFEDIYGEDREMETYSRRDIYHESYVCGYARTKDIRNAIAEYESTNIWD